jgi:hypothetical protein
MSRNIADSSEQEAALLAVDDDGNVAAAHSLPTSMRTPPASATPRRLPLV